MLEEAVNKGFGISFGDPAQQATKPGKQSSDEQSSTKDFASTASTKDFASTQDFASTHTKGSVSSTSEQGEQGCVSTPTTP
jgi:hypothetical protein